MVMPVHDKSCGGGLGQAIDHSEAMPVRRRRLV